MPAGNLLNNVNDCNIMSKYVNECQIMLKDVKVCQIKPRARIFGSHLGMNLAVDVNTQYRVFYIGSHASFISSAQIYPHLNTFYYKKVNDFLAGKKYLQS